jgi:hypothetical protein
MAPRELGQASGLTPSPLQGWWPQEASELPKVLSQLLEWLHNMSASFFRARVSKQSDGASWDPASTATDCHLHLHSVCGKWVLSPGHTGKRECIVEGRSAPGSMGIENHSV